MSESCKLKGPYFPTGDIDWECRTHGNTVQLRDPNKRVTINGGNLKKSDLVCTVPDETTLTEGETDDAGHLGTGA